MAYVWQRWIADELRAAGLTVVEVQGWENRGRPASTGQFDPQGPSTAHHTGVLSTPKAPAAGLSMLINGRSDLPGPLCQVATAYDGTVYVIAAGRANHAGRIGKSGVFGMPVGTDGNARALGNEVITNGTQKMPKAQSEAVDTVHAVFSRHFDKDAKWVHRHQDISGTGKWDLGGVTTAALRSRVAKRIKSLDVTLSESAMAKADARKRRRLAKKHQPLRRLLLAALEAEKVAAKEALGLGRKTLHDNLMDSARAKRKRIISFRFNKK